MAKRISYLTEYSQRINDRLKDLQRELPTSCTDYFRSMSQTTSPLTRLAYAYDLRLFFQYLNLENMYFANSSIIMLTGEDLSQITARDIVGFQDYLQQYVKVSDNDDYDEDSGLSPTLVQNYELGIMRKLSCIRSYFDYLFRNELIPANVASMVTLPKRHEKPILYLEPDEVQRLMDAVVSGEGLSDRQKKYLNLTKKRDIAILMMFLGTGIRVSELVGLDTDHLDFSQNAFMVTRKGGNQIILYYPDTVKETLENYLMERETVPALPGHEYALFLSLQRRRITSRAVENLVKKYAQIAAPLKKRISPHKLRSTFATTLYQQTGDIYLVSDALGHADVNTTKRNYADIKESKRKEAAQKITLPDI